MSYAKIDNGTLVQYPYYLGSLKQENPGTSFPSEMPERLLAEYGVYPVAETAPPATSIFESAREIAPAFIDGEWRQQWEIVPAPVPQVITPRQCRILLLQQGLLPQVEAMVAAGDDATRITWEYAVEFQRNDPLLLAMAAGLGLTEQQLDEFFMAASQL